MSALNNVKIGAKLTVGFVLVAAIAAAIGAVGVRRPERSTPPALFCTRRPRHP